jgi:hypothetical protein
VVRERRQIDLGRALALVTRRAGQTGRGCTGRVCRGDNGGEVLDDLLGVLRFSCSGLSAGRLAR